jgi:hypothetical protein
MKYVSIGAALIAIAALATPAAAQQVITNPGRCAQYYPNANCQNLGPGNPYTGSYQRGEREQGYARMGSWEQGYARTGNWEQGYARMGRHHRMHGMHHRRHMHRMH